MLPSRRVGSPRRRGRGVRACGGCRGRGRLGACGDEPGTAPGSPDGGVPQEDAGGLEDALSSGADGAAPEPPSDNAAAPEPAVGSEQHGEEDRVAGAALYVSSAGSDADGDGNARSPSRRSPRRCNEPTQARRPR
ncbi:MAG: hypothetical protein V8S24_01475 [Gordonibacter pamelaeae]